MQREIEDEFDLEQRWQFYLKRVGIHSEDMLSPIQRREMKNAFMAGMMDMLVVTTVRMHGLPNEEIVNNLDRMSEQGKKYFRDVCNDEFSKVKKN